ncbi:MAG: PIG-L family deacetylase [Desulfobacterales bacterium]
MTGMHDRIHYHDFTLMAVHAHPDDESIGTGGILAKYASEGVRTVVVYCTRGEEGDIINPEFVLPDPAMSMIDVRMQELGKALAVLKVGSVYFLGYRDSGMAGSPKNTNPSAFAMADVQKASGRLVDIIRETRPDVIVTYNEKGLYGHPDHIMANRITQAAFHAAGNPECSGEKALPVWQPKKLYYTALSLNRMREMQRIAQERGEDLGLDPDLLGTPDDRITTCIDVEAFLPKKFQALFCHRSQVGPDIFFKQVPRHRVNAFFKYEYFVCISGCKKTFGEKDLFEGI